MPSRRIMLQINPESTDALREISTAVEKADGKNLPAPLIFPPVLHFTVSEETAKEIKTNYEGSILRIMTDEEAESDE
ncbi:uncharacterized protein N7503_002709 [Penicillium pulvis]|uniref:uncharacterized protein n=1 Tax=Penicillium pulvis TaxID=1562058 RepID=UPI002548AF16|nr:uncharacterized protein N7503_002709 [Penicillium pulvis]KAJ5810491.1 hypothetical protein N7503_002709 [Penicillium pulvis]